MRLAKTWAAVAGAAVVGVVWALSHVSMVEPGASGQPRPEPRLPEPAAAARRGSTLGEKADAEELVRLKSRMTALEREMATAHEAAPKDEAAAEENESAGAPEEPQDPKVAATALAKTMDDALEAEAVDPEWTTAMDGRIQSFFGAEELRGSSVRRTECKSTLCRLDVVSESVDAKQRLTERISGLLPPKAQGFAHIDEESDLEIEVYIMREGRPSPGAQM